VTVQVHDAKTDRLIFQIVENGVSLASLAFSPDSQFLAIGYGPPGMGIWHPDVWNIDVCFITIWDMHTGALVHRYYGHTGAVYGLSWSPDSRTLASRSADGTILLWPVAP
jgi:WD40 repeat protein